MKKYFLHNGSENIGPFDIEELKEQKITKETQVWYEGLVDWKEASEIEELKSILPVTPPPLTKKVAPQSFAEAKISEPKKKNIFRKVLKIIAIVLIVYLGAALIINAINENSSNESSYVESVMTIEQIEAQSPLDYLNASGTYNENFFGDAIKVNGIVTNSATMTTYKDITIRVDYYSKTKTLLNSEEYMLYEFYSPNSTKEFKLKVKNYNNVASLGWEVVNASVN
ncbi:DUF4339 domain-containing protein [uncultured Flavobacterium sp.]|uniref:DUF4339 domain-containing protein n=1 Tax=uncultured Flavobacterium sp. TaxID=165435 RepID=UPI0030EE6B1F|tara:strand:- start:8255 stop:8932 length:678 start_codon:yes stop_codon:yes gene_type:complete